VETGEAELRHRPGLRPGRYVLLTLTDTGVGMTEEVMASAFEPFFTTKEVGRGTGLGLATVYGLVKQFEGYVYADSTPGKGTAFLVYLPRCEGDHWEAAGRTRGGRTVLVVDNEATVRALVRHVLEGEGHSVLEASDGTEALAVAKRQGV